MERSKAGLFRGGAVHSSVGIREGPVEKVTVERGSEGGEGGATAHLAGEGSKCFPTEGTGSGRSVAGGE